MQSRTKSGVEEYLSRREAPSVRMWRRINKSAKKHKKEASSSIKTSAEDYLSRRELEVF
jgi:hypothetical protein